MASVTFPLKPQSDAKRRHFCRLFPVFLIIRGSSPLQTVAFFTSVPNVSPQTERAGITQRDLIRWQMRLNRHFGLSVIQATAGSLHAVMSTSAPVADFLKNTLLDKWSAWKLCYTLGSAMSRECDMHLFNYLFSIV